MKDNLRRKYFGLCLQCCFGTCSGAEPGAHSRESYSPHVQPTLFKTVPLVTFFVQMATPLQCLLPPCVPCSCEHTAGLIHPKIWALMIQCHLETSLPRGPNLYHTSVFRASTPKGCVCVSHSKTTVTTDLFPRWKQPINFQENASGVAFFHGFWRHWRTGWHCWMRRHWYPRHKG